MKLLSIASTHWEGDLLTGSGTTSVASEAFGPVAVSWSARTEDHGGLTSPEELIAAAHASCYSMSLSSRLAKAGTPPTALDTEAVAHFEKLEAGWKLVTMAITVRGIVPGASGEAFAQAAERARDGCPVSQALKGNVEIPLDAALAD